MKHALEKTIQGKRLKKDEWQRNGCFRLSGQKRPEEMPDTVPFAGDLVVSKIDQTLAFEEFAALR